ncbi:HEAT repeat domain-containing protein [bacterium]|nr:HEAT repeat domain-containing protein [bacterium]
MNRIVTTVISLILLASCVTADENKLLHAFLVASSDDAELSPFRRKAIAELIDGGEKTVDMLVGFLATEDEREREAIKEVFRCISKDAEGTLLRLLADKDRKKVAFVVELLGEIKAEQSVIPLILLLNDPATCIRAAAAASLGKIGDPVAADALLEALSDSAYLVRENAAYSLGMLQRNEAVPYLITALSDSCFAVRYAASWALARLDSQEALDSLNALLDVEDELTKAYIVETIGAMRDTSELPLIFSLLENPSSRTRGFACDALSYFRGNWRVANRLKQALHDPSPFVRMKANQALAKMSNENY